MPWSNKTLKNPPRLPMTPPRGQARLLHSTVDPWEPLKKLGHCGAVLEVLEQCGHRHSSTPERPSPAELIRVPFNRKAFAPIGHLATPFVCLTARLIFTAHPTLSFPDPDFRIGSCPFGRTVGAPVTKDFRPGLEHQRQTVGSARGNGEICYSSGNTDRLRGLRSSYP